MGIIRFSIDNPVKVAVAALLLGLFGIISLRSMPVQMTPTVDRPEISITSTYRGAAPQEVEEQITNRLEERLQAVEGLREITSTSGEGRSSVELQFDWGVNKDIALIDIIKRLARLRDFPDDAEEPIIIAGASSERRPVYWANMRGSMTIDAMRQFADKTIAPRLERVEGVANVRVFGGEKRQIVIEIDFEALAARALTLQTISAALQRENLNVRGGSIDVGKRKYLVRTLGLFKHPDEIGSVILSKKEGAPVYLRDVAKVYDTYAKRSSLVRIVGKPAIAFGIVKKSGANTISLVEGLEKTIARINKENESRGVTIYESYDSSDYIWESIAFVTRNFAFGALLALLVLILFLRSFRSAFVIGVSIPIVAAAGFMLLNMMDRSLNIISLAGMAFAVGMVVDNAIVALENIYRHLQMGKSRREAALDGAAEVWGALLASTLTTLAVFVPIVSIEEEAGQLFKDIAIAISVSVSVSLIVAITIIPTIAARVMALGVTLEKRGATIWNATNSLGTGVTRLMEKMIGWLGSASRARLATFVIVIVAAALATIPLAPKMEYLPTGNRNLIFVIFKPHTGANFNTVRDHSDVIADRILQLPEVKYMFHVVSSQFNGIGVRVTDEYRLRIGEVVQKVNAALQGAPGFQFARAFQTSLFSRFTGSDVQVDITGPGLSGIARYSGMIKGQLFGVEGVAFARSNLETGAPEFRVVIDRERAADFGLRVSDIAEVVETLVAGKKVSLYKEGGNEYDILLKGNTSRLLDGSSIGAVTLFTPEGEPVRLDSVATIVEAVGPTQISHIELERSVSLSVTKKPGIPLQKVVENIEKDILIPLRKTMEPGYSVTLSGSARDLERTAKQLSGSFLLALFIVYLVMAALFESFLFPLVIMFSVPLAASGAIIAIRLTGSSLDVLTQLGFIILTGIVVNNAILLVHQARQNVRLYAMEEREAILDAIRLRVRPIFMSSLTTIFGMAPLAIGGGAGAELYSGLASAIVGGLTVSTLFTLALIPAISLLLIGPKGKKETT